MKIKVCPECGKHNLANAWSCVQCGRTLAAKTLVELDDALIELDVETISDGTSAQRATASPTTGETSQPGIASPKGVTMYCTSCGKQTPDNSTFCLYCGTRISSSITRAVTEWEYQDFVYNWPPGRRGWVRTSGSGGYTVPAARIYFWQESQAAIAKELQRWFDEGWEPVGEVGPAAIKLRQFERKHKNYNFSAVLFWILTFGFAWLMGLGSWTYTRQYCEPIEFRVQMRRPKR